VKPCVQTPVLPKTKNTITKIFFKIVITKEIHWKPGPQTMIIIRSPMYETLAMYYTKCFTGKQ
jgi:hypothetical protein